jgi:hypothetical protein
MKQSPLFPSPSFDTPSAAPFFLLPDASTIGQSHPTPVKPGGALSKAVDEEKHRRQRLNTKYRHDIFRFVQTDYTESQLTHTNCPDQIPPGTVVSIKSLSNRETACWPREAARYTPNLYFLHCQIQITLCTIVRIASLLLNQGHIPWRGAVAYELATLSHRQPKSARRGEEPLVGPTSQMSS